MEKNITSECVIATLGAQGVATDAARAQSCAALLGAVLKAAAHGRPVPFSLEAGLLL